MSKNNLTNKIKQALQVSRMYYLDGASQVDIAHQLQLSRPTVSRLLQFAKEQHLVEIKIQDPFQDVALLRQQLQQRYQLKEVLIASQTNTNNLNILESLGQQTANYLDRIVHNHDIIGISWGRTMAAVAHYLHPNSAQGVQLVQLKGSVANSQENNYAFEITHRFNQAFQTTAEILPLPVIFDNVATKKVVFHDRFINSVLEKGRAANIALYTVGTTLPQAMLFRLGYFTPAAIKHLQQVSVGDLVSRFITAQGQIADAQLNERTVSIELEALKKKDYSILVAGGLQKVLPIKAALAGGYPNVLITDIQTAQKLLS
ncbi:sugar-binding transcriptional regulator [Lactobacillus mellis]|nr:sugar-binding transcriptional regulator [Bombilactobacillus mellis]NUF98239.1 sugar-binding transcriptional regulator [Bombilactobacillus mellis]